ncbi:hypothetical protein CDU01_07150 [Cronobacter sakazakii]|nr:hypothetical protein [Cronobacter sakazakii]EGT5651971.1 hypothetical protein [Cronobacter sakazakii]EGT5746948.1 hypothetical protein [Cronobacter sakazakii]EGT5754821.1 hypothetical protein [Cronobacter sakazakii]PPY00652.1 hypothetical protein C3D66_17155 [Cronobacter sakazakii]
MAHILLSGTYKSNNFSRLCIVCTITAQSACFANKKAVLSTQMRCNRVVSNEEKGNGKARQKTEKQEEVRKKPKGGCASPV